MYIVSETARQVVSETARQAVLQHCLISVELIVFSYLVLIYNIHVLHFAQNVDVNIKVKCYNYVIHVSARTTIYKTGRLKRVI